MRIFNIINSYTNRYEKRYNKYMPITLKRKDDARYDPKKLESLEISNEGKPVGRVLLLKKIPGYIEEIEIYPEHRREGYGRETVQKLLEMKGEVRGRSNSTAGTFWTKMGAKPFFKEEQDYPIEQGSEFIIRKPK